MDKDRGRIEILEVLRGLAAFAVAWFHFTHGAHLVPEGSWLWWSGRDGWLGVEVFFVISGFVIPYAMHRGGYRLRRDAGTFVLKRVIRLDPPYLATIGVTIALGWLSSLAPGFRGTTPQVTMPQVLAHLGYVNVFLGYPWLNPVFWTLAIEFQFYLVAALLYPTLVHRDARVRAAALAAMCLTAFALPSPDLVFHYGAFFALGGLTFQRHVGLVRMRTYVAFGIPIVIAAALAMGPLPAVVGAAAALTIALVRARRIAPLAWLGTVSYSLYLLHVPIGGRVVNLGARFAHGVPGRIGVLVLAAAASLFAAWVMYMLVERPAQRIAGTMRYGPRREEAIPETVVEPAAAI